jgi:hypothetical protein
LCKPKNIIMQISQVPRNGPTAFHGVENMSHSGGTQQTIKFS